MNIYEIIIAELPELENSEEFRNGNIILQDDSDGIGAYIRKWNYSKPIPNGLTLGKPSA
jgi:hypothetical protein